MCTESSSQFKVSAAHWQPDGRFSGTGSSHLKGGGRTNDSASARGTDTAATLSLTAAKQKCVRHSEASTTLWLPRGRATSHSRLESTVDSHIYRGGETILQKSTGTAEIAEYFQLANDKSILRYYI